MVINPMIEFVFIIPMKFWAMLKKLFINFWLLSIVDVWQKELIVFGRQTRWSKIWPPNLLGSAQKNFNHISKKISHSMDCGLISTIDLIIEDLKFLPQKNSITIGFLKIFWLL